MKWKKVTAVLLSMVIAATTAACGSTREASPDDSNTAAHGTETAQTENGQVPTLTLFVDETWWPYEKWEGAVPEELEKRLGVNIEVTRAADENQLSLMVASGDMPDIICSYRYQYLADSQVCYPLDELHETYPEIEFNVDPIYQFVNQAADGHYYTIGCGFSPEYEYDKYDKILLYHTI